MGKKSNKKIGAIVLLAICLLATGAWADSCVNYEPTERFASSRVGNVKQQLEQSVAFAVKVNCQAKLTPENFSTNFRMISDDMFLFSYSYHYGWRETDYFTDDLLYMKQKGKWTYIQSLDDISGISYDLNADGLPEFLQAHDNSFRAIIDEGKSIVAMDMADGKFKIITGLEVYYKYNTSGRCPGPDESNYKEDLEVKETGEKYPLIVLSRTSDINTGSDYECGKWTEQWQYQWDPEHKRYMNKGYSNANGEVIDFGLDKDGKVTLTYKQSGKANKLGSTFSVDSSLYDYFKKNGLLYFKAEDAEWQSQYAWDMEKNELYFRAKKKTGGKVYMSKSKNTKAVFEKMPWLMDKF